MEHLKECIACLTVLSTFDFHETPQGMGTMAINYFVKMFWDALRSMINGTFIANNVPFINRDRVIDNNGGMWISGGKGSHSYTTDPQGKAHMKSNAGVRNGSVFVFMLFMGPFNCAQGEFFIGKFLLFFTIT